MKNLKTKTGMIALAIVTFAMMSCKDVKKEVTVVSNVMTSEVQKIEGDTKEDIIDAYMELKNTLVADDTKGAAKAGGKLEKELDAFDISGFNADEQKELLEIIEAAKEHAEHIAESEIDHQREHFKGLSTDMIDFIAIVGAPETVYQQYCPMYDKGSAWLSINKKIMNPYYGSKMLHCGTVQKELK